MQIDSVKMHEALNTVAIKIHDSEIISGIDCINSARKLLASIEAETACNVARDKSQKNAAYIARMAFLLANSYRLLQDIIDDPDIDKKKDRMLNLMSHIDDILT